MQVIVGNFSMFRNLALATVCTAGAISTDVEAMSTSIVPLLAAPVSVTLPVVLPKTSRCRETRYA